MPDDKFLDYFIKQSEEVAPGTSTYWIKLHKTDQPKFVKSDLVKAFSWSDRKIELLVKEANNFEHVFIHSFTVTMADFILKLRQDLPLTWMFWGYDGYGYTFNESRWLLPSTRALKKRIFKRDSYSLRSCYRNFKVTYQSIRSSLITRKILKRINTCATWVKYDYEMIRPINPIMKWKDYNYYSFSELGLDQIVKKENVYSNIWIGNSAALTNNHADALEELKKMNWQGNVYMPLSYGNIPPYSEEIIRIGKAYFGDRFHPITEFMSLKDYQDLINNCGIIWMNHVRQQAAGNIMAALYFGKAVILHPASNLYKTFKEWNLKLHAGFQEFFASKEMRESYDHNKAIIEAHINYEHSLKCVRQLYGII
jgi:hypothetical protein